MNAQQRFSLLEQQSPEINEDSGAFRNCLDWYLGAERDLAASSPLFFRPVALLRTSKVGGESARDLTALAFRSKTQTVSQRLLRLVLRQSISPGVQAMHARSPPQQTHRARLRSVRLNSLLTRRYGPGKRPSLIEARPSFEPQSIRRHLVCRDRRPSLF